MAETHCLRKQPSKRSIPRAQILRECLLMNVLLIIFCSGYTHFMRAQRFHQITLACIMHAKEQRPDDWKWTLVWSLSISLTCSGSHVEITSTDMDSHIYSICSLSYTVYIYIYIYTHIYSLHVSSLFFAGSSQPGQICLWCFTCLWSTGVFN